MSVIDLTKSKESNESLTKESIESLSRSMQSLSLAMSINNLKSFESNSLKKKTESSVLEGKSLSELYTLAWRNPGLREQVSLKVGYSCKGAPLKSGVEIKGYQKEAISWIRTPKSGIRNKKGGILCFHMGLGKTFSSLCATIPAQRKPGFGGTLVVCPLSVLTTWKQEIEKFFESELKSIFIYPKTELMKYTKKELIEANVVVTTYETISNLAYSRGEEGREPWVYQILDFSEEGKVMDVFNAPEPNLDLKPRSWEETLFTIRWNWLVYDESQKVGNYKTKVWRGCMSIWSQSTLLLSGTPVMNDVGEYFTQFRLLGYNKCNVRQWKRDAKSFLDDDHLEQCIYTKNYEDVGIQLPEIQYVITDVILSETEKKVYDSIRSAVKNEYNQYIGGKVDAVDIMVLITRLRQSAICANSAISVSKSNAGGETTPSQNAILDRMRTLSLTSWIMDSNGTAGKFSSKLNSVVNTIRSIPKDEKFIVFSTFTHPLELFESRLEFEFPDLYWVYIDGSVTGSKRESLISQYQTDPKVRGMLITLKTGCTGLNLACSNHILIIDEWWNDATTDQGIARAFRVGQTKSVKVYRFPVVDSIEQNVRNICEQKTNRIKNWNISKTSIGMLMRVV